MRRRWLAGALGVAVLAVAVLGLAWRQREAWLDRRVGPPEIELFQVAPGESFRSVAQRLERGGWIERSWLARLEARVFGWDHRVYPGFYAYRAHETTRELLARFATGAIEDTLVTLPEGWPMEKALELLSGASRTPLADFHRVARDGELLARLGIPGPSLDGYFLPETYRVPLGQSAASTLEQIVRPGLALWEDSLRVHAEALGLDRPKLWALASIIEAESAVPEERGRIAAVFWNRIRRGMKLESDPTVLFALGRPPGRVLYRDLEVDSPYNTYRYPGIPPGPICAPGRASLWAAVRPMEGVDDLFFVARGDGTHVFSKTLSAHNRAKADVRRRP